MNNLIQQIDSFTRTLFATLTLYSCTFSTTIGIRIRESFLIREITFLITCRRFNCHNILHNISYLIQVPLP